MHDVLDVENRRQGRADRLAIIDRHRSVGALGHDLHGHAVLRRQLDPHQTIAEIGQNRLRDLGDPRSGAGLGDEARLAQQICDLSVEFVL